MRISTLLIGIVLSTSLLGQSNTKTIKAEKLMDKYNYPEAIHVLEGMDTRGRNSLSLLAECYRLTGNYDKALATYEEIERDGAMSHLDLYYMAALLRTQSLYAKSAEYMERYLELTGTDSRAHKTMSDPKYYIPLIETGMNADIKNLDINTEAQDFAPVVHGDQAVFASSRRGISTVKRTYVRNEKPYLDLYTANIEPDASLSNIEAFNKQLNGKFHEGPVAFDGSGMTMMLTRNNYASTAEDGTRNFQLFESIKENGKWSEPQALAINSPEYSVGHATLSADGKTMVFASDMPGGQGGSDLYVTTKGNNGAWSEPLNLGDEVNTEGNEMFPHLHQGGMLFFASDGLPGLGGLDVFAALWLGNTAMQTINFGFPVNDTHDDFGLVLRDDMQSGYFTSNRPGGAGDDDIYSFNLEKKLSLGNAIEGYVVDLDGNLMPYADLQVVNVNGETSSLQANEFGYYRHILADNQVYDITGCVEGYLDGERRVETLNDDPIQRVDVLVEKNIGIELYCLITDAESGKAIDKVEIGIQRLREEEETLFTGADGSISKWVFGVKKGETITYAITLKREGYLPRFLTYQRTLDKMGRYNLHEEMNLDMHVAKLGVDISAMVDLEPIYFDLNKYSIRDDAAEELDKIVQVLSENPEMVMELGSHSDCRGSSAYNLSLSQKRARSSAQYIKKRIENPERIYGKGYGESEPVSKCACESRENPCSDEEHQANRRTEFVIVKM